MKAALASLIFWSDPRGPSIYDEGDIGTGRPRPHGALSSNNLLMKSCHRSVPGVSERTFNNRNPLSNVPWQAFVLSTTGVSRPTAGRRKTGKLEILEIPFERDLISR